MKKLILCAIMMILVLRMYAQHQLNREFVVTSKGDTLYGATSLSSRNFREVKFAAASGQTQSFTSSDISSFYSQKWGVFVTAKVRLDISKKERLIQTTPLLVFLELFIKTNDLSIYYFKSPKYGSHYFIRKGSGPFEELIVRETTTVENGKTFFLKSEPYKTILADYLNDCPAILSEIKKTNLSQNGLQNLLAKYSACRSVPPAFKAVLDATKLSWGISASWFISSFKYKPSGREGPYNNSKGITLGLSTNYIFSVKSGKASLLNELVYKSIATSGTTSSPDFDEIDVRNYKVTYLRLNTLVRYNFIRHRTIKPFFQFGISNSVAVAANSKLTTTNFSGTTQTKLDTRGYEQGWLLGAGVNVKRTDIFVRIETSNGLIPPNYEEKIPAKSFYVGLTFRIGK